MNKRDTSDDRFNIDFVVEKRLRVEDLLTPEWLEATASKQVGCHDGGTGSIRTAIYARYSPRAEETEASIVRQIEACKAYLDRIGAPHPDKSRIFIDRMATARDRHDRPALTEMLGDLEYGGHTLGVAEHADRWARDLGDLARIHGLYTHSGGQMHTVDRGQLDRAILAMQGFLGMEQRLQLAARTTVGRRMAAEEGRFVGRLPYGYRKLPGSSGVGEVVPDEAAVVRRIFAAFAAGASARRIVIDLNADKVPAPGSCFWNGTGLVGKNGLLRRSVYAGHMCYGTTRWIRDPATGRTKVVPVPRGGWTIVYTPHLAIVDPELWNKVSGRLSNEYGRARKPRHRGNRLLTGRIFCPCGSHMNYFGASATADPALICAANSTRGTCGRSRSVSARIVEADVLRMLRDDVLSAEAETQFSQAVAAETAARERSFERKRRRTLKRLSDIEARIERLFDPDATSGMASQLVASARADLEHRASETRLELEAIEAENRPVAVLARDDGRANFRNAISSVLARLPFVADDEDDGKFIRVLGDLVDRIVLDLSGSDRSYRLRIELGMRHRPLGSGRALERSFDAPRFGYLGDPDRAKAATDAAERGLFSLSDDDWETVEALFGAHRFYRLEPRRLFDALLFHAWTGVPVHLTPACFGDPTTLRAAGRQIVRNGTWKSAVAVLDAAGSPAVAGLDAGIFDRWAEPNTRRSAKRRRG